MNQPTREADWRDAIAFRAVQIGKWTTEHEHFWPRIANLTLNGVLLQELSRERTESKQVWHDPLSVNESFAVENLAARLLDSGYITTDPKGEPDLNIEASKNVWITAYQDLPELCGAPVTGIADLRGRWFANIAAATAEKLAADGAVTKQACHGRYYKLDRENRFLCSRFLTWKWPKGPREELRSSGVDFINYIYDFGSATSAVYTHIFQSEPSLHAGARIRWDFGTWLRAGWEFGHRLHEQRARELIDRMVTNGAEQDLDYTHRLLGRLYASAPGGVGLADLGKACVAYIKEIHGLVRDGHGPEVCLHAMDYGFFMAVGLRGMLPPSATAIVPVNVGATSIYATETAHNRT